MLLYNVMYDLDPEGLEARGGIGAKKKKKKGNFWKKEQLSSISYSVFKFDDVNGVNGVKSVNYDIREL